MIGCGGLSKEEPMSRLTFEDKGDRGEEKTEMMMKSEDDGHVCGIVRACGA